jgi:hypothetical protein
LLPDRAARWICTTVKMRLKGPYNRTNRRTISRKCHFCLPWAQVHPIVCGFVCRFVRCVKTLYCPTENCIRFAANRMLIHTRLRILVQLCVRFHARFALEPNRVSILYDTQIATVCLHILGKINPKFNSNPTLAGNHTQNRTRNRLRVDGPLGI